MNMMVVFYFIDAIKLLNLMKLYVFYEINNIANPLKHLKEYTFNYFFNDQVIFK